MIRQDAIESLRKVDWKMPDDSIDATSKDLDELLLLDIRLRSAAWNAEWVDPSECMRFPLRSLAPNVVDFLVEVSPYSARDRKFLVNFAALDCDHHNAHAFYDAVLDIAERGPWAAAYLDMAVAFSRITKGKQPPVGTGFRIIHRQIGPVLPKLATERLRVKNKPDLAYRLSEFTREGEIAPDVAAAVFYEYGLHHYLRLAECAEGQNSGTLRTRFEELLAGRDADMAENWVQQDDDPEGEVQHMSHSLAEIRDSRLAIRAPQNEEEFDRLQSSIAAIAEDILGSPRDPLLYEKLSLLAGHGKDYLDHHVGTTIESLLERLASLGHTILTVSTKGQAHLMAPAFRETLAEAEAAKAAELDASAASEAANSAILAATKAREFGRMSELGTAAQSADDILTAARAARAALDAAIATHLAALPVDIQAREGGTPPAPNRNIDHSDSDLEAPTPATAPEPTSMALPISEPTAARPELEESPAEDPGQDTSDQTGAKDHLLPSAVSAEPIQLRTQASAETLGKPTSEVSDEDEVEDDLVLEDATGQFVLAKLIDRDLFGIAADAASALEAQRSFWPLRAQILNVAAAGRAPLRGFGAAEDETFKAMADAAAGAVSSDLDAVVLLGAILRPAITQKVTTFRKGAIGLARGSIGQHLSGVVDLIDDLPYDFPPSKDELARLSGVAQVPQRDRIAAGLVEWCETISRKSSRWRFATAFMHHVASEDGLIGAASAAISAKRPNATELAEAAIAALDSPAKIEAQSQRFRDVNGMSASNLFPRGVEKLNILFSEALSMLADWLALAGSSRAEERNEGRYRAIIGKLWSRLEAAATALREEMQERRANGRVLEGAIAEWLVYRCVDALTVLGGGDIATRPSLEDALSFERDLLPFELREQGAGRALETFLDLLSGHGVPEPIEAYTAAIEEGAFETAQRLAERFSLSSYGFSPSSFSEAKATFVETWIGEIERRERSLRELAKVDFSHQAEMERRQTWCHLSLDRLRLLKGKAEVDDLADIPMQAREFDLAIAEITTNIRADQETRIRSHRTAKNAEDVDALLRDLEDIAPQIVEDRISQLRDGRSTATFTSDSGTLIAEFTPAFIAAATAPGWPKSGTEYRMALAADGPLATDEARREPAEALIGAYLALAAAIAAGKPTPLLVKSILEKLGFEAILVGQLSRPQSSGPWRAALSLKIPAEDGWFLPPVFGSRATGYGLVLAGPGDLPETVKAQIDANTPTLVLLVGVADISRRREFAMRFRGAGLPILLIDEALVAFAATRLATRLRTIFECGLPYGRIEPYWTDAGPTPREMFFGRKAEISAIMSRTADGSLVFGGRQLGKSALLNHVAQVFHDPAANRIVVTDTVSALGDSQPCEMVWSRISAMLSPHDVVSEKSRFCEDVSRDIRGWLARNAGGQIVCMLDESDKFLAAESQANYHEITELKTLMERTQRSFKVIFAGLHNVQRMYVQSNSPLAHLGSAICIGPLNRNQDDKRAAHELVVAPMAAAGFAFEDEDAAEAILSWANYYPSLVQEYAKGLVATLNGSGSGRNFDLNPDGPLWKIPTRRLFEHQGFEAIESRVRGKFHLTLELDPRYALVAYTLAWLNTKGEEHRVLVSGYRPEEFLKHARVFWPKTAEVPEPAAFEALLDEMFELGMLGRIPIPGSKRYSYCLASRRVASMLGSHEDVWIKLLELEQKDPSLAYDRTIHRRSYPPPGNPNAAVQDHLYSPLTDQQIERITDTSNKAVRIVCGLDILGLDKVPQALSRLADQMQLPGVPRSKTDVQVLTSASGTDLRHAVDRFKVAPTKFGIVIYTPTTEKEARNALQWLDRQLPILNGDIRAVLLLNAADKSLRDLAIRRREDTIMLLAWHAEMLRVHLHNIEADLDSRARRDLILEAAGGIPSETIKLVAKMRGSDDSDQVARDWKPRLSNLEAITRGSLGLALGIIEETDRPADYNAMNELIRDAVGADLSSIGDDLVALGLISGWSHAAQRIRRAPLGNLIVRMMNQ
jgi:hypothetical protein